MVRSSSRTETSKVEKAARGAGVRTFVFAHATVEITVVDKMGDFCKKVKVFFFLGGRYVRAHESWERKLKHSLGSVRRLALLEG